MAKTYDMDVAVSNSISDRQEKKKKKKKNLLLDPVRKNQLNPKNKSQSSTFIKRQQKLKDLMENM